jgi:hypothetical protein|nr:MAG TPA: hypothetical protein [Caudoviricetes sp.]
MKSKWGTCQQTTKEDTQQIYRAYRIVLPPGVELDFYTYGTRDGAAARARELNAKEKAPEAAATAQGARQ